MNLPAALRRLPWPGSLFGRLLVSLSLVLVGAQLLSFSVLNQHLDGELFGQRAKVVEARIAESVKQLEGSLPSQQSMLAAQLGDPAFRIRLTPQRQDWSPPSSRQQAEPYCRELGERLSAQAGDDRVWQVEWMYFIPQAGRPGPGGVDARVSISAQTQLRNGVWASFQFPKPGDTVPARRVFLAMGLLLTATILIVALTVALVLRPLVTLKHHAEALGQDINALPLPTRGVRELAAAAGALNAMQAQLQKLFYDRTRMLSAISHDFKTPLTRLKLRLEFIHDKTQRDKLEADITAMESLVEEALSFLRSEYSQEAPETVDLNRLLRKLAAQRADCRQAVVFQGTVAHTVQAREGALQRCIDNLIDNALKYGGEANVILRDGKDAVVVEISDRGPGIPSGNMEKMFEPFYRGDAARTHGKAGHGLGLSIARQIARTYGGDVRLRNGENGGLVALLILPC